MQNIKIVAKGISEANLDPKIKECLQTLFNYELANSTLKNPQYKTTYENVIRASAKSWEETSSNMGPDEIS